MTGLVHARTHEASFPASIGGSHVNVVTMDWLAEYGPFSTPLAVMAAPVVPAESGFSRQEKRAKAIIKEEAERLGLLADEITTKGKGGPYVAARDMAIYRIRTEVGLTLAEIGALFRRDHTTVLHAFQKVHARGGKRIDLAPPPPKEKRGPPTKFDHDEAMRMLAEGRTLKEVGDRFGVTRERVRQVAQKAGVRSIQCRANVEEKNLEIERLVSEGLSDEDIASQVDLSAAYVAAERVKLGFKPFKTARREAEMAPFVEMVRHGRSMTSVAREFGVSLGKLQTACGNAGVRSRARSRHSDLSGREVLVRSLRGSGMTWHDVGLEVLKAEGRVGWPQAIYTWAQRHCPDLVNARA